MKSILYPLEIFWPIFFLEDFGVVLIPMEATDMYVYIYMLYLNVYV